MRRIAITLLLVVANAGCSALRPVNPPDRPSPEQIVTDYHALIASFQNLTPSQYVKAGYRAVDAKCDLFFDQLARAARSYDFVKRETVLGIATASSMLSLLHNTSQTLAIMAAGSAFAAQSIDNAEDYALVTRYHEQLKFVVNGKRDLFKQVNDPANAADAFAADDFVRRYANICTLQGLELTISESIENSMPAADFGSQLIAVVSRFIKQDIGFAPSLAELRDLVALLDPQAAASRKKIASGSKWFPAVGIYWLAKSNVPLTPLGSARQAQIAEALAALPPSPPAAPAPPPPPPSAETGRFVGPPATPAAPPPITGGTQQNAIPIILVPKPR